MGYHLDKITKGVLGELSKIQEELDECFDAEKQNCKIMLATELSDLYGALEHYAEKQGFSMEDLKKMAHITKRAFDSGRRVNEDIQPIVADKIVTGELNNFACYKITKECRLIRNGKYSLLINDSNEKVKLFNLYTEIYNPNKNPIRFTQWENEHVLEKYKTNISYPTDGTITLEAGQKCIVAVEKFPILERLKVSAEDIDIYKREINKFMYADDDFEIGGLDLGNYRIYSIKESDYILIQTRQSDCLSISLVTNYVRNVDNIVMRFYVDNVAVVLEPDEEWKSDKNKCIFIDNTDKYSLRFIINNGSPVDYNKDQRLIKNDGYKEIKNIFIDYGLK